MPNRTPRRPRRLNGLIAGIGAMMLAQAATAADLTVTIADLRSARGEVHIALYDDAQAFPKDGRYIADQIVPANAAVAVFADLAPGTYAIATYHDENGNGGFDRGLLGLPLEGYGFSNDAHAVFGPPDFEEAAFQVEEPGTQITIHMVNW
ncbi:MAG: DUF2141 domain-containing protein [Rhodospirillales bacterium]|nr:DUF2141 domain-containing protein [Rhodospirillales bacterium]